MKVEKWTGNEAVSVNGIIAALNEILATDPDFMEEFITTRLNCNHGLRDHPTVQVHCYDDASIEKPKAGFLGILNGLIGVDKNIHGSIAARFGDDGKLYKFHLTKTY